MRREEDYMDQLFKDHFEDFAQSPGEGVWKGVVANGAMANGKKLSYASYWKVGLVLGLGLFLTFGILKGYQMLNAEDGSQELTLNEVQQQSQSGKELGLTDRLELIQSSNGQAQPSSSANAQAEDKKEKQEGALSPVSSIDISTNEPADDNLAPVIDGDMVIEEQLGNELPKRVVDPGRHHFNFLMTTRPDGYNLAGDILNLDHLRKSPDGAAWASFNDPLSVKTRRDLSRSWMDKVLSDGKTKGGHWFVSGAFVADASLQSDKRFILGFDGLAFGAGKYLTPDSFIEVSLRGAWSNGFNMRATYARLFLPGRLRPYVQGGLVWDNDLRLRMGLGLLYTPQKLDKWRFYVAANYEGGFNFQEQGSGATGVFEIGAQIRLSGTERVLSDNNWMNSIPLYELPKGWYADVSTNFSFDDKTKVVDYQVFMGKYLKRRLFIRGGLRVDKDEVAIPVQVQYHFLLRKQLRFGAYTGVGLEIQNARLGAELGLIAYYEIKPGWSLFVAPVILEGSSYTERLFETGIQFKLSKKK